MTPTHYHIHTNQRGMILKIFGGTVCRFLLETPETYRRYGDNYDTEIKTIVCSLDNLRPITKQTTLF